MPEALDSPGGRQEDHATMIPYVYVVMARSYDEDAPVEVWGVRESAELRAEQLGKDYDVVAVELNRVLERPETFTMSRPQGLTG